MGKRLFYLLKFIFSVALFCGAVYFENAHLQRFIILVVLFAVYLGSGFARFLVKPESERTGSRELQSPQEQRNKKSWVPYYIYLSFYSDIVLIFYMEQNSRLLINYFFHSFYLIVLLEAALTLRLKRGIAVGTVAVLVSMIKYGALIYYKPSLASVSQMGFFLLVSTLILVVAAFAQYNREEREKKDILYKDLLDAHRQLKQYADEVNRLSVLEERNRIARNIIHEALQNGASRNLLKNGLPDAVADAIRAVYAGSEGTAAQAPDAINFPREFIPELQNAGNQRDPRAELLTEREIEICRLIAEGKNNQEIAKELYLSMGTVKNHITRILIKLDMRDRTQLAIFTIKNGL